ncbi:IclR family transcriptional regulator [Dactylosporangium sp. CA-233914]|uniref:IclR family transcriptional regulator n=1 Tax=Dactylosporangium sp. CA-233914 TaxID=3239934 RepID=UPI003D8B4B66
MTVSALSASPEWPGALSSGEQAHGVSSAAKALAMLDAFAGPRAVLGVSELARSIGVPKSTAHRLLSVMVDSGYVCKVGDRYCLTDRVFELGNRVGFGFLRSTGLRRRAMPYLSSLFVSTRETIHLATLTGADVLYLEKLFGPTGVRCSTAVGSRRPAYATALGKAILAFSGEAELTRAVQAPFRAYTSRTVTGADRLLQELESIRASGLATDRGEMQRDMHCIAVPILDPQTGRAVAAVSICSLATQKLEPKYGQMLRDTARELSRQPLG